MGETAETASIEQAGGRLCTASKTNHELVCDLRNKVGQLRSRLLGPIPETDSEGSEKGEASGLIFKVSGDLERTNTMLRESIQIMNKLNQEFEAEPPIAQAG